MQSNANAQPAAPQAANVPNPAPIGPENKMVLWLILGLVLIIVVVGGIYWYLSNKQKSLTMTNIQTTTQSETPTASENLDTLGTQADSENVPDATSDFSALDRDLQSL